MRSKPSSPNVEVYCNQCRVSFPVGSRRCLHCGGRLDRERIWTELGALPAGVEPYLAEHLEEHLEEVLGDELPRRSRISPLTLVWIGLLLAGYLYRSCMG